MYIISLKVVEHTDDIKGGHTMYKMQAMRSDLLAKHSLVVVTRREEVTIR